MTKTIMLIHGAWLTPDAWGNFKQRYEAAGYTVYAPAWPMLDRSIAELRRDPDPAFGALSIGAITDHYDVLIRALPEPPILMGHSFGGLIVQLLLDRGLGAAGVAIDPGPPAGVLPTPVALRAALPVLLTWAGWNKVMTMSPENFARDFANTLSGPQAWAAYERYVVPAPGRIYFQAALGVGNRINWSNDDRAPLLLIAGEKDRTADAAMVRAMYRKHRRSRSVTDFRQFAGRSHWLCAEAGWEQVADTALEWAAAEAVTRNVPQRAEESDKNRAFVQSRDFVAA